MKVNQDVLEILLQEAKKRKLKWLVQQGGANLFPNEDSKHDYANWVYTDDIEKTVEFVKDIGNYAHIVFDKGGWVLYIRQYHNPSPEDISDYTTDLTWVEKLSDDLDELYGY